MEYIMLSKHLWIISVYEQSNILYRKIHLLKEPVFFANLQNLEKTLEKIRIANRTVFALHI